MIYQQEWDKNTKFILKEDKKGKKSVNNLFIIVAAKFGTWCTNHYCGVNAMDLKNSWHTQVGSLILERSLCHLGGWR